MTETDEWPPKLARTREAWAEYWKRQKWHRRKRRELRIWLAPWHRRIGRLSPRRLRNDARHRVQRMRRGWSRCDLWSMDAYICRLLGEMTAEMKRAGHGYPCVGNNGSCFGPDACCCTCEQDWSGILDRISGPLLAYETHWEYLEGETTQQHLEREKKVISEAQDALRLMADHLPSLWD